MNKLSRRYMFAACFLAAGLAAHAAPAAERAYAIVDSVQMPAWVERNGVRQPLEPGKVLRNRDRVLTGSDARLLIQLDEGSAVRLGENAQLDLNALGRREGRVFTAALDVVERRFPVYHRRFLESAAAARSQCAHCYDHRRYPRYRPVGQRRCRARSGLPA